jgi:hypothetical protein
VGIAPVANALPIGFGYNQGSIEINEVKDKDFYIYFDKRTPVDGALALKSLRQAKPHLENWFQYRRDQPLIVNIASESENASFANFITDSVELQTMGQGSRDLVWHEFTHTSMYAKLQNVFGPAGAIFHLPWMEAWFLEGLAESTSVSVGSAPKAAIERFQAVNDSFPSWDRIHSLYTSGPFSFEGYATSGAFVRWILTRHKAQKLPIFLETFRDDTMPWWWLWAFTPLNSFWPMDSGLQEWTSKRGSDLYENYKLEAKKQWGNQNLTMVLRDTSKSIPLLTAKSPSAFSSTGKAIQLTSFQNDKFVSQVVVQEFDRHKSITNESTKKSLKQKMTTVSTSDSVASYAFASNQKYSATIEEHWAESNTKRYAVSVKDISNTRVRKIKRNATWIQQVWLSEVNLYWIETLLETSQMCRLDLSRKSSKPNCFLQTKLPETLAVLGEQKNEDGDAQEIWIRATRQLSQEDRHRVIEINPIEPFKSPRFMREIQWTHGGRPMSMAKTQAGQWMHVSDRSYQYIRRLDNNGVCKDSLRISDFLTKIIQGKSYLPYMVTWEGPRYALYNPNQVASIAESTTPSKCTQLTDWTSPLLAAENADESISFDEALSRSSIWDTRDVESVSSKTEAIENNHSIESDDGEKNLEEPDQQKSSIEVKMEEKKSNDIEKKQVDEELDQIVTTQGAASWRGRPIFLFPWIGADDALGTQIGIVSVPLMDHLQNETVRATVLVGVNSRFPYTDIGLTQTRFTPTWNYTIFRAQTYNGRWLNKETDLVESSFLDERGARIEGNLGQRWQKLRLLWSWGTKGSDLLPYFGQSRRVGFLNEWFGGSNLSYDVTSKWTVFLSTQAKVAPKTTNRNFEYDVLGASLTTQRSVGAGSFAGSFELGIEGERTRGPKRRDVQEMYVPLKTFVPGNGGGYNKNNFALTADQGLFSPIFGENQARAKTSLTFPIIKEVDKFTGLIYIDRLDFTGFLNHGGAWSGSKLPDSKRRLTAHGYNIDLLMDNKGVRFNTGLGVGQLLGESFQAYFTAGFDALF